MGFRDFIKALASNPNVVDDETVNEELEEFLAENKESVSRVRSMEEKYAVDAATKKKLNIASGGKADGISKKRENAEREIEESDKELEK